jgi:RHS repeat-associated protein
MTVVGEPAVSYEYDSAGHITRISQAGSSVSFTYDSANRRASTTLPNGIGAKYVYDNNSRVAEIDYLSGANVLGNITYAYDVLGQRTEIGGSFARTGMPDAVSSATYDDANQLTNWNGLTIKYDADGNILSDGANVFDWNARGQLIGVNKVFAQYDAFGRRTKNFRGTAFIYDGVNAVQELVNGTPAANRLTGGMDEFFSRSDASGTFVPIVDALGSVLALTDGNGILATQYIFDPFGGTSSTGVASTNPFQFTGRENDDVGLYYARARYYNPRLARFMSEDPVGRSASPNLYSYAANSPANFTDPTGKNTATLGYLGGEVAGGIVCFGSGVCEGALIVAGVAVGVAALYYLLKPADNIPGGQVCESRSNPYRGPPGTTSSIPGQDRRYGPDGYPDVDVDYGHDHGQGSPHAHDWDRPANGDPPTHEDRGPGRPVQPSDPKPNSNPNPNSNPKP